jgi:hypothetical protein
MSERLEILYAQICDGSMDSAARQEFLDLMRDPKNRKEFVNIAVYEVVIADELKLSEVRGEAESIREHSGKLPAVGTARRKRISGVHRSSVRRSSRTRGGPRPSSVSTWVSIAALLMLSIGAALYLREKPEKAPESFATLSEGSGNVSIARGAQTKKASAGEPLVAGDQISVSGGSCGIHYADGTEISVDVEAVLALSGSAESKQLELRQGKLAANVTPQKQPLKLKTPHSEATVIGTQFTVAIEKDGTRLEVNVGHVKLADLKTRESVEVPAGQFAIAGTGKLEARPINAPSQQIAQLLEDFEAPQLKWNIFTFKNSTVKQRRVTPGKIGVGAIRIDYDIPPQDGGGGSYLNLRSRPQDWSPYSGVSFWFYGNSSGHDMAFELMDNQIPGHGEDTAERFVFEFKDDFSGWRFFTAKWADFKRRNWQPAQTPNDGLTLKQINGFDFIAGPGSGWFMADHIALIKD